MTLDMENAMKAALDGHLYCFTHNDAGGMKVIEKKVPKDFVPSYDFTTQPLESGRRGGLRQSAKHAEYLAAFWTDAKISELRKFRALDHGARKIGRMLGISRLEVGKQLNKMGLLSRYGVPYQ